MEKRNAKEVVAIIILSISNHTSFKISLWKSFYLRALYPTIWQLMYLNIIEPKAYHCYAFTLIFKNKLNFFPSYI